MCQPISGTDRKLFRLPDRDPELTDQLMIIASEKLKLALWIDSTTEIVHYEDGQLVDLESVYLNNELVEGVLKMKDERILICAPNQFLSMSQIEKLSSMVNGFH